MLNSAVPNFVVEDLIVGRQIGRVHLQKVYAGLQFSHAFSSRRPRDFEPVRPPLTLQPTAAVIPEPPTRKTIMILHDRLPMAEQKAIAAVMKTAGVTVDMRAHEMVTAFKAKGIPAILECEGVALTVNGITYRGGAPKYAMVLARAFMFS